MNTLGKSFMFYLRYPAEMDRLYWKPLIENVQPSLDGLADGIRVQKMAHEVGMAASQEAAELLADCGEKIEEHFTSLGCVELAKIATPTYLRKNWRWQAMVRAKETNGGWFQCGVSIYEKERVLAVWVWRSGGRAWQQRVLNQLAGRLPSSRENGPGTVELGAVAIPQLNAEVGVDSDILVSSVASIFGVLRAEDALAFCRRENEDSESEPTESSDRERLQDSTTLTDSPI